MGPVRQDVDTKDAGYALPVRMHSTIFEANVPGNPVVLLNLSIKLRHRMRVCDEYCPS